MGQKQSLEVQLIEASKNNDTDKVKSLLKMKVNPNYRYTPEDTDIFDVMLEIVCTNSDGINYEFYAITHAAKNNNTEMVKNLLEHKANPNCGSKSGFSPLIWAAYNNNLEMVKVLIEYGANVNYENFEREKALNYAVYNLNSEMVEYLSKKTTDINSYESPVTWAKRTKNINILKKFNTL